MTATGNTDKTTNSMTGHTSGWGARTTQAEDRQDRNTRRYGRVTLASGRVVQVDHGPDFAALIRADADR